MGLRAAGSIVVLLGVMGCARSGGECPEPPVIASASAPDPAADESSEPATVAPPPDGPDPDELDLDPDTPPEPSPPTTKTTAWPWPGPECIALSPRQASYACVSLTATPTTDSAYDLSSPSMHETMRRVRATRADVELGVELVSVHGASTFIVVDTEPDAFTTRVPLREVKEQLRRGGYDQPVTAHSMLEPDTWVKAGEVWLRYSTRTHEGDASFEIYGKVELCCTKGGAAQELVLVSHDDHIGGPFAMVSSAGDSPLHAITIEHHDGGEGYVDVRWSSWVFDALQWCPPP